MSIGKNFKVVGNDISDGFHTFDELYEHRCLLFINLCLMNVSASAWKPHYEGWPCLMMQTKYGQISYHVPEKFLFLFDKVIDKKEFKWDGHTSEDVISRLQKMAVQ